MGEPEGSWYSPRLLLSLIFELSPDSRFTAARRDDPEETREWRAWGSRTFQSQLMAALTNWTQIHAIGGLQWPEGKGPTYTPVTDPGSRAPKKRPPTLGEIHNLFASAGR